jgi:hypothetical protein
VASEQGVPVLGRAVPNWTCAAAWVLATAIFAVLGFSGFFAGRGFGDAHETMVGSLALAHGQWRCAFPPGNGDEAPLYPLLSSSVFALVNPSAGTPFPHGTVMSGSCDQAAAAVVAWVQSTGTYSVVTRIGYLSWLALLAGFVLFLRAARRGRCVGELVGVVLLALLPPVALSVLRMFHPEDLLALGLALAAAAAVLRRHWTTAGALLGLAFCAQPLTLLVAIPLVALAVTGVRILGRLAMGGAVASAVVLLPVVLLTHDGIANAFLGAASYVATSRNLVGYLPFSLDTVRTVSFAAMIAGSAAVSWWARARCKADRLAPDVVLATIAVSLGLRILLDTYFWGYYLAPVVAVLVLFDLVHWRIRPGTLGLAAVCAIIFPVHGFLDPVTNFVQWHPPLFQVPLFVAVYMLAEEPFRRVAVPRVASGSVRAPAVAE